MCIGRNHILIFPCSPVKPPRQIMARATSGSGSGSLRLLLISPSPLHSSHISSQPTPRFPSKRFTSTTLQMSLSSSSTEPSHVLEILGGASDSIFPIFKSLTRPYKPFPLIGWDAHVETVFAALFRTLPGLVRLRRECLRTADGGSVALDWVSGDDRELPPDSPVLILLEFQNSLRFCDGSQYAGLTGGSGDTYIQHMLVRARRSRWRVVVYNSRGCANSPVTTAQFCSASFTEDLREVVKHVRLRFPSSNLYGVGWSIGANILVRYLGEESHNCPLSGAVSLCNPFNLVIADEDFHKGFNNVYDKALANGLTKILNKHALLFEDMGGEYNIQLAANAKTLRDFDEGLTRISFGFKSVDDYYSNSSSSNSIKDVQRPLLCIQAGNDPIAPARGIPRDDIQENPNCLLIVTPKGGHLGWVAGDEAPLGAPWTDPTVMEFLEHLERGKVENVPSLDTLEDTKITINR